MTTTTDKEALTGEIDALRVAYEAIRSQPPEAHERMRRWLDARLDQDFHDGRKAAMAIARAARKIERIVNQAALRAQSTTLEGDGE